MEPFERSVCELPRTTKIFKPKLECGLLISFANNLKTSMALLLEVSSENPDSTVLVLVHNPSIPARDEKQRI